MDLATIRSATFRGQTKPSKGGNARPRRTMWVAGQVSIARAGPTASATSSGGPSPGTGLGADLRCKAYTATVAKMARTAHAIVKGGEPYRPFLEGMAHGGRTLLS
jgi:hypothetical protein